MTTIRRQLTWKLLVAFTAPLVLAGAVVYALIRDEMIEQFDSALTAKAAAIAAATRLQADGGVDLTGSAGVLSDFDPPESGEGEEDESPPVFEIRRLDGSPLARSVTLGSADLSMPAALRDEPRFWNLELPSGVPGRAVGMRFRPGIAAGAAPAATTSDLLMVTAVDRRELDRTVRMVALLLSGCGAVLLLVTFVLVPRVVRREFQPLDELGDQASHITAESLGTRFSTDALPGELEPIGRRLNDLLARLETSFDRERRFSADLAHELRTPVAELRSLAELAVKWPDSRAVDADRDVLAIASRMEGIVTRLLAMLRHERGDVPVVQERVNASALVGEAWRAFEARAEGRGLQVAWDVPANTMVDTDPVLLRSVVSNLLQNAVDYAPAAGAVAISGRSIPAGFELRVRNRADELSADDVERLFDRFWRRDAARSDGDHVGLGLSLARALAQALGGTLTARRDTGGDLEFILTLPA